MLSTDWRFLNEHCSDCLYRKGSFCMICNDNISLNCRCSNFKKGDTKNEYNWNERRRYK